MKETAVAKLFNNGGSQAVRLPKEFRFKGDKVRLKRVGNGVLIEPLESDIDAWFARMDRLRAGDFIERPPQPPMPKSRTTFD